MFFSKFPLLTDFFYHFLDINLFLIFSQTQANQLQDKIVLFFLNKISPVFFTRLANKTYPTCFTYSNVSFIILVVLITNHNNFPFKKTLISAN